LSAPFGAFRTGDGHVIVAVLNPKLFEQFTAVIGRPDLLGDSRFKTDSERAANESILRSAFEDWSLRYSTSQVVAALSDAGVPAAAIMNVGDAVDSEHAKSRKLFRTSKLGDHELRLPEQPAIFSTMQRGRPVDAPKLDEHSSKIRTWIKEAKQT
jgi:CoA:oxalate CoA-transferase